MRILFAFPGHSFPYEWVQCWTNTFHFLTSQGIAVNWSFAYSCNIYFARNMCLGGDVLRGENQKPFDGKLDYDYLMWIDSDIIWHPSQVLALIKHQQDIVQGVYYTEDGQTFPFCEYWDEDFFERNGYFKFINVERLEQLRKKGGLHEVYYGGLGFTLVKGGVFEQLKYPWFETEKLRIGNSVDICMEDVHFCIKARRVGFKILIDPFIHVGHKKGIIL
jgi:hypothetical protein